MPELRCTVQTCVHNKQFYCDLDKIQVGGNRAQHAEETCCDSFEERRNGSYSNVMGYFATPTSSIDCKARDCMYNRECVCHAGKISVEGGHASKCQDTECATFVCGR